MEKAGPELSLGALWALTLHRLQTSPLLPPGSWASCVPHLDNDMHSSPLHREKPRDHLCILLLLLRLEWDPAE